MVKLVQQDLPERVEHPVNQERLEDQATRVLQDLTDRQVLQDLLVLADLREWMGLQDQWDLPEVWETREQVEEPEYWVLREPREPLVLLVAQVPREHQEYQGPWVIQDSLDKQVLTGHQDQRELLEPRGIMEQLALPATQDLMEPLVRRVPLVHLVLMVLMEALERQDQWERRVLPGQQDPTVEPESKELLVVLVLQDYLELQDRLVLPE